jgi:hypothetical protein
MKVGLVMLKHYEKKIILLKYEELLHFLINDLMKNGLFLNENYSSFLDLYNSIQIKDSLINNLENENIQENKFRDFKDSMTKY